MRKVNWGIIGLGNIALKFANGFKNVDNAKLKSVSSKNNEKVKIVAINQLGAADHNETRPSNQRCNVSKNNVAMANFETKRGIDPIMTA